MREAPPVLVAALSSRYRFEREIGSGGMATVYLARDLKHDRDVAIKVMRPDIAVAVGADRFLAEIKTTAQLRHPHILALFDSGSADSALFYVMPFIEGESLRQHVRRLGPLPIGEAVRILRQLADALTHAHARGVIHRDVKSDNVLVSGRHVFLADFGIARALAAGASAQTVTGTGMMVGTPGYMAPEQIVGGAVDHRTDIYAFGALAYELLTGSPAFTGTTQDVVNAQLTRSAEAVTRHRPDTPPALAALVMRCLQRDAAERWQRTDDLVAVLDSIAGPETAAMSRHTSAAWNRARYATLALVVTAAVAIAWYATRAVPAPPDTTVSLAVGRITHVTSDPGLELDPAISPDGRTIAYAAGPAGRMRIYLRQVAGGRSVPLTEEDTDPDAQRWPRWSSDGTRIVFQGGRQRINARATARGAMLYQVSALGGIPRRVLGAFSDPVALSPSWSSDGREIVFGGSDGLYTVAADGDGTPRRLIEGAELYLPRWSPDGSRIAYVKAGWMFTFGEEGLGNVSTSSILVATPATGRVTPISPGEWLDTNPIWMPDGRTLLFISSRGGGRDIYSVRISPEGQVEQQPERLTSGLNAHTMSLSTDGRLLAYASYAANANIWAIDIPEKGVASVADAEQITFSNEKIEKLAVTSDGQWLAYDSDRNGQADIWKVRLPGGTPEQVTRGPNHKFVNDWSPDGSEILFHTIRGGQRDVFVVSADGLRTEPVATTSRDEQHSAWGPDGNTAIFDVTTHVGAVNEWQAFVATRPHRGAPWGTARQLTKVGASDPKWSPDGRWIAYCVRGQLRVIAPDGSGDRALIDVTSSGGPEPSYPVWSRDSRTIYYKAYDRDRHSSIWSVPIAGGTPRAIVRFDDPSRRSQRREFATDGRRFYFTVARDESDVWVMELQTK